MYSSRIKVKILWRQLFPLQFTQVTHQPRNIPDNQVPNQAVNVSANSYTATLVTLTSFARLCRHHRLDCCNEPSQNQNSDFNFKHVLTNLESFKWSLGNFLESMWFEIRLLWSSCRRLWLNASCNDVMSLGPKLWKISGLYCHPGGR